MAELPKIRTPWRQQWRRVRYQLVPVICFSGCVLLAAWLWQNRAVGISTLGEVEIDRRDVIAAVGGMLVPLPEDPARFRINQLVRAGEPLVKINDAAAQAAIDALHKTVARLRSDLAAKHEEIRLADHDREENHLSEARRLAVQVEDLRLRILDRQALIVADQIELARQSSLYEMIEKSGTAASALERLNIRLLRDAAQQRIDSNREILRQAQAQLEEALKRAGALPALTKSDLEKLLQPIRDEIQVQESQIRRLEAENAARILCSPIDGRIAQIYRYPGQNVQPGEIVATVVSTHSTAIVSYIRQDQRIDPAGELRAEVRLRFTSEKPVEAAVLRRGATFEPIPPQLARDPKVPEWGIPVFISIPSHLGEVLGRSLVPGELVEVRLANASHSR